MLESKRSLVQFPAEAYIIILNFSLISRYSSVKTIQMKSSMTFIQGNGCIRIDFILKKGGCLYDDMSAFITFLTSFKDDIISYKVYCRSSTNYRGSVVIMVGRGGAYFFVVGRP